MKYPTLYKETATGAIQVWWQEQDGSSYRTVSGQIDGVKTESEWTECTPKNIGKTNETSATEQCIKEIEANYKKKKSQGKYVESLDSLEKGKTSYISPMLAHNYQDNIPKPPVFVQPKLDGIRCIANKDGLWSRQGKSITSCPHIWEAVKPYVNAGYILDGELYSHEHRENFNAIVSAVRKKEPTKQSALIQYWVYDLVDTRKTFAERWEIIRKLNLTSPIIQVPTQVCTTYDQVDEFFANCITNGFEGEIVRTNTVYQNKRTKNLLKRKEFLDGEFEIVEICEGEGNRSGMAGYVVCKDNNNKTFKAGIKGGEGFYITLLRNASKYKGGTVSVKYFHLTPDGLPRFPVAVAFYEGARDI